METVHISSVRSAQLLRNEKSIDAVVVPRKPKSAECFGTSYFSSAYNSKAAITSDTYTTSYSSASASVSQPSSSSQFQSPLSQDKLPDNCSARATRATASAAGHPYGELVEVPESSTEYVPVVFARAPSDPIEEYSARLMGYPASTGRLLTALEEYALLGREGCVQIARGKLPLPPPGAACRAVLASLVAPPGTRRAQVKAATHARLAPPAPSAYGTAADAEARAVYAYVLAFVLQQQIQASDVLARPSVDTTFSCPRARAPSIALLPFVQRVLRYLPATKELYIVALVYLDRVVALNRGITLTLLNVHRLFIAAVHVASKFFDDLFYSTSFVARVAGVPPAELNRLELEFLAATRFSLFVEPALYTAYAAPFLQLVGVCRALPLAARVEPPPYAGPALLRASYTVVDELFVHLQNERLLCEPSRQPPRRCPRTGSNESSPRAHSAHSLRPPCAHDAFSDCDDSSSSSDPLSDPPSDASSGSDSPSPHQRVRPRASAHAAPAPVPGRIVVTVSAPDSAPAPAPVPQKPVAFKRFSARSNSHT